MAEHDSTAVSDLIATRDGQPTQQVQRSNSAALFAGSRELIIEHNGREYRLRLTQNGKMILTA